jgi:thiol-disulfide isomerase/thioredoxin
VAGSHELSRSSDLTTDKCKLRTVSGGSRYPARVLRSIVLGAALVLSSCAPRVVPPSKHPLVATQPRVVTRPDLQGRLLQLPAAKVVTVIDFWATYCEPCKASIPRFEQLGRRAGVAMLGVAVEEDSGLVAAEASRLGASYPILLDQGDVLRGLYRVAELPATFVLDRQGRVRFAAVGGGHDDAIEAAVDALLAE